MKLLTQEQFNAMTERERQEHLRGIIMHVRKHAKSLIGTTDLDIDDDCRGIVEMIDNMTWKCYDE